VTPDEFGSWLEHPCTEALVQYLRNNIRGRQDLMAQGGCLAAEAGGFEAIGQSYYANVNAVRTFEVILDDLKYEVLFPPEEPAVDEKEAEDASEE